ncbi:hypothetical protein DEIGR_320139 [Deinococcus grandis]|uniref:Uncharacterized protein n=1 Tax=Deinococcus grandis TaxID=57498 RepID=A0A100HN15_9DEIO|nr:hypothetical protein DEGR_37320 [Deinococcus grandis]GAQ23725.1 hypothetical protein DEIGR_320139 [Deinococcus grandis]
MTGRDALGPQFANRDEDRVRVYDIALSLAYAPDIRQALVVVCEEHPLLIVEVLSPTLMRLTTTPSWPVRHSDMPFRLYCFHMHAMMRAQKVRDGCSDIHGMPLT